MRKVVIALQDWLNSPEADFSIYKAGPWFNPAGLEILSHDELCVCCVGFRVTNCKRHFALKNVFVFFYLREMALLKAEVDVVYVLKQMILWGFLLKKEKKALMLTFLLVRKRCSFYRFFVHYILNICSGCNVDNWVWIHQFLINVTYVFASMVR